MMVSFTLSSGFLPRSPPIGSMDAPITSKKTARMAFPMGFEI